MSPMTVSWIVFGCIFTGALTGMLLRRIMPEHHLSAESKDTVKLGMGLIASMSALVLGLLVASAKGSFDAQRNELTQMSANVIFLDRLLARYGPETNDVRAKLRLSVETALERIWPADNSQPSRIEATAGSEKLFDSLEMLSPKTESQRALLAQAQKLGTDMAQTRWLLFAQRSSSIPTPFLVVLVFWLTITFVSFGLFAPTNLTVMVTFLVSALSVGGAIFMILELDQAFGGIVQISSDPLRNALAQLGH